MSGKQGAPRRLRCSECKLTSPRQRGLGFALRATGRTMLFRRGRSSPVTDRTTDRLIEVECLTCGHVGFTNHRDAEQLLATWQQQQKE